jgi:hypothetical protein
VHIRAAFPHLTAGSANDLAPFVTYVAGWRDNYSERFPGAHQFAESLRCAAGCSMEIQASG